MSIASELNNLEGNIEDSYDAVNDMGGIIPQHKNMDNLDQAIRTIPQGSSYTAGSGIDITGSTISVDNTTVPFFSDLATVATTGDYVDLINTPTIPTKTSDLQNDGATGNSTYVEATALSDGSVTKVGTSTVGATDKPIYLASGTPTQVNQPTSGAWFQGIPRVTPDGVMEMGKYIDFHNASSDTKDYSVRLYTDNTGSSSVLLPNSNGRLAIESQIPDSTSDLANDGSDGTSTYVEADELATVATSGDYDDLLNKPTIPAAQVNSDWNASSGVAQILNKPTLATVATSGAYSDLSGTPSIITPLDIYPVGAIYMSVNNTNPGMLFGGTWEQIQDRFILAAGSTYAGGATGGAATINLAHSHTVNNHNHSLPANTGSHTLTINEMPSHNHGIIVPPRYGWEWGDGGAMYGQKNSTSANNNQVTSDTGGGQGHTHPIGGNTGDKSPGTNSQLSATQSILPPYLAVYVWKRTA